MSGPGQPAQLPQLPVSSSHLASVGHNEKLRLLDVVFKKTGDSYRYQGVPSTVYQALLDAPSKGKFFNSNIKSKYKSVRLSPPKKKQPPQ